MFRNRSVHMFENDVCLESALAFGLVGAILAGELRLLATLEPRVHIQVTSLLVHFATARALVLLCNCNINITLLNCNIVHFPSILCTVIEAFVFMLKLVYIYQNNTLFLWTLFV